MARSLRSLELIQVSQDPSSLGAQRSGFALADSLRAGRAQVRQANPGFAWCFTLNNPTEAEVTRLKAAVEARPFTKYIVANEKGEEGTPHLQGWMRFQTRIRPISAFKHVALRDGKAAIHWEPAKGTQDENYTYITKDTGKEHFWLWTNCQGPRAVWILGDSQLHPWQAELDRLVSVPPAPQDRRIHWVFDPSGGQGKSALCKYLSLKWGAALLSGKLGDIVHVAAENEADAYLFDFTRAQQEYIPYTAMEQVKNGHYMSGKYEGKIVVRNTPHIICFANFAPRFASMTKDRWRLYTINCDKGLEERELDDPEFEAYQNPHKQEA